MTEVEENVAAIVRSVLRGVEPSALAPHQTLAAAAAVSLLQSRGGVLLADAAGVGKTLVAIAVARFFETQSREVAIFVPAALVPQWTRVCEEHGVRTAPVSHERLLRELNRRTPELVIVDEAHRFRNPAAVRHARLAAMATGARVLLITATPVWNSNRDLTSLLRFLMPDYALQLAPGESSLPFDRGAQLIRRTDEVLPSDLRFPRIDYRFVEFEESTSRAISDAIESLTFPGLESRHEYLLRHLLWRRLESSGAAFRETLRRLRSFVSRLKEAHGQRLGITRREFRRLFPADEGDLVQELLFPEVFFGGATEQLEPASLDREIAVLTDLMAHRIEEPKRELLRRTVEEMRGPAIVFTSSIATARSLYEDFRRYRTSALLTSKGAEADGRRVAPSELLTRHSARGIDLLFTTDLGGEGLDLQSASVVIHYDLPWNLARIEQRNGRVSRIGQTETPVAVFFLPLSSRSGIDRVLLEKTRLCGLTTSTVPEVSFRESTGLSIRVADAVGETCGVLGVSHGSNEVDELLFVSGGVVSSDVALLPSIVAALRDATNWRDGDAESLSPLIGDHVLSRRGELALPPLQRDDSFGQLLALARSRREIDLFTGPLRGMVAEVCARRTPAAVETLLREAQIVRGCSELPHRVVAAVIAMNADQRAG